MVIARMKVHTSRVNEFIEFCNGYGFEVDKSKLTLSDPSFVVLLEVEKDKIEEFNNSFKRKFLVCN